MLLLFSMSIYALHRSNSSGFCGVRPFAQSPGWSSHCTVFSCFSCLSVLHFIRCGGLVCTDLPACTAQCRCLLFACLLASFASLGTEPFAVQHALSVTGTCGEPLVIARLPLSVISRTGPFGLFLIMLPRLATCTVF